jgi:hypothetical protein
MVRCHTVEVPSQKALREAKEAIQAVLEAMPAEDDSAQDRVLRRHLEGAVLALEELTKKPSRP